jgi:hypothetical protein
VVSMVKPKWMDPSVICCGVETCFFHKWDSTTSPHDPRM